MVQHWRIAFKPQGHRCSSVLFTTQVMLIVCYFDYKFIKNFPNNTRFSWLIPRAATTKQCSIQHTMTFRSYGEKSNYAFITDPEIALEADLHGGINHSVLWYSQECSNRCDSAIQ